MDINKKKPDEITRHLADQLIHSRFGQWSHTPGIKKVLKVKFLSLESDMTIDNSSLGPDIISHDISGLAAFTAEEKNLAMAALETLEKEIGIDFVEVKDGPAELTFGHYSKMEYRTALSDDELAEAKQTIKEIENKLAQLSKNDGDQYHTLKEDLEDCTEWLQLGNYHEAEGLVLIAAFNPNLENKDSTIVSRGNIVTSTPIWLKSLDILGKKKFAYTLAHEIGHALGLDHLIKSQIHNNNSAMLPSIPEEKKIDIFNQSNPHHNSFGKADLLALKAIYSMDKGKPVDLFHRGEVHYDVSDGHARVSPMGCTKWGNTPEDDYFHNKKDEFIQLQKGLTPDNIQITLLKSASTRGIKLTFTDHPNASLIIKERSEPLIHGSDTPLRFKNIKLADGKTLSIDAQLYQTLEEEKSPQWQAGIPLVVGKLPPSETSQLASYTVDIKTSYLPARTTLSSTNININDHYIDINKYYNFLRDKYAIGMTRAFVFFKENNYDEEIVSSYINNSKNKSLKKWLNNYLHDQNENKNVINFKTALSKLFYTKEQTNTLYENININGTYQDLKEVYNKHNIIPPSNKEWLSFSTPVESMIVNNPLMVVKESSDVPLRGTINIEITQKSKNKENNKFNIRIRLYEDGTSQESVIKDIISAITDTIKTFIAKLNITENNLFNRNENFTDINLTLFKNSKSMRNAFLKKSSGNIDDLFAGSFIFNFGNIGDIYSYINTDMSVIRHEIAHALDFINARPVESQSYLLAEGMAEYIANLAAGKNTANFITLIDSKYKTLTLEDIFNKKIDDDYWVYTTGTAIVAYIIATYPNLINKSYNTKYIVDENEEEEEEERYLPFFFDNKTKQERLELERRQIQEGKGFNYWIAQNPEKKEITQTIKGTKDNDSLIGNDDDELIIGFDGDDKLYGGKGNDRLIGSAGDDKLSGSEGNDYLSGDRGNDQLRGEEGDDVLSGGKGNDSLAGDKGDDELYGGEGNDALWGNEGHDILVGGKDNDVLVGGEGNDQLYGSQGKDILWGNEGDDILVGGEDDDELHGGEGDDTLLGSEGDDRLLGGKDNDTYIFDKEFGQDIIYSTDNKANDKDSLIFRQNISKKDLWLKRQDLDLQIILTPQDKITINDFYLSGSNTIQEIIVDGYKLSKSDITGLADAMVTFNSTHKTNSELAQNKLQIDIDKYWQPIITTQV